MAILLIGSLAAAENIAFGYKDFQYPKNTGSNSRPTGEKPESKLWFNDGTWWGILWSTTPTSDAPNGAYRIHRLDLTNQHWVDTRTTVDARRDSRSDVGWDGTHLYVASHLFATKATRDANCSAGTDNGKCGKLFRFSYNLVDKIYTLDGVQGGANVKSGKTETLVLAKDTKGVLWVTYVEDNQVMVNYSENDGLTWATPFALPGAALEATSGSTFTDDIATIVAYDGHVGIMWSHQRENNLSQPHRDPNPHSGGSDCAPDLTVPTCKGSRVASDTDNVVAPRMRFAVHEDGADPSVWSSDAIYTASGDDHISLKAFDHHLYAAFKEEGNARVIGLLACETGPNACRKKTDWKHYTVYQRKDNDGNSPQANLKAANSPNPTRPSLLIDGQHGELYVFVSVEQGLAQVGQEQIPQSTINYKKTKLDAIRFDTKDAGVPFIKSATDLVINDPTSTKQLLSSETGLLVLASDGESRYYFHNYLPIFP